MKTVVLNLHVNAIGNGGVYVALGVGVDAVWKADFEICEDLAVVQAFAVCGDVEPVDAGWIGGVVFTGKGVRTL